MRTRLVPSGPAPKNSVSSICTTAGEACLVVHYDLRPLCSGPAPRNSKVPSICTTVQARRCKTARTCVSDPAQLPRVFVAHHTKIQNHYLLGGSNSAHVLLHKTKQTNAHPRLRPRAAARRCQCTRPSPAAAAAAPRPQTPGGRGGRPRETGGKKLHKSGWQAAGCERASPKQPCMGRAAAGTRTSNATLYSPGPSVDSTA